MYMLPEIAILTFLMMNEIYLRMIGLFFETENEIESILDGLKRNIERGDVEIVQQHKEQRMNMNMYLIFAPKEEQKEDSKYR